MVQTRGVLQMSSAEAYRDRAAEALAALLDEAQSIDFRIGLDLCTSPTAEHGPSIQK